MVALELDINYATKVLTDLLSIPSPTGFTELALDRVERYLSDMGIIGSRTPKGALIWTIAGKSRQARTVISHIDTLGVMVKEVKENRKIIEKTNELDPARDFFIKEEFEKGRKAQNLQYGLEIRKRE